MTEITRRNFLKKVAVTGGALALSGSGISLAVKRHFRDHNYPGNVLGSSARVGHLLREAVTLTPIRTVQQESVIIGGGISGLSAGWWLRKKGYADFKLLELEPEVGGNSQFGQNEVSAYPWGAHYLPLPGPEAQYVRELLEEVEVIQGFDAKKNPIYNEFYLCADPHERLYIQGRWQEGLIPQTGMTASDRREYDAFFRHVETLKTTKGKDGKRAFSIPMELSSRDPEFIRLDEFSMAKFLRNQGWNSRSLHWYVNYCCRDDYGMGYEYVSAWAGLHYFASRIGAGANADSQTVLTWPEGNGWLAAKLRERCAEQIQSNALVFSVKQTSGRVEIDFLDCLTREVTRVHAKQMIFAAPRFVAGHVIEDLKSSPPSYLKQLRYAPWMVANVTLESMPESEGAPLSWDNVSYYSQSLGYVVATHQSLSHLQRQTVLTVYFPLDQSDPKSARKNAAQKTHREWAREVVDDLERIHRGIKDKIKKIDVWVWGHGMISPAPGFLWGKEREKMLSSLGRIQFAHSDMSGISIFEEAQFRGVSAAQKVLSILGKKA